MIIFTFILAHELLRIHSTVFVFVSEVLAGIRRSAGAVSIPTIPFFDTSSPIAFARRIRTFLHGLLSFSSSLKLPCNQVTFIEESYIAGATPNSKQVLFSFRIYLISFHF